MEYELVAIVNYCEELILMYGHLDFETARTCMYAYETLKDLVADTSDIVEKICIETALKMTKNNRVATAEMLNLSRQSLYVKLRKYNLL